MQHQLFGFLDSTPTALHTALQLTDRLSANGFTRLDPRQQWQLEPGGRYVLTRGASVVAWISGHSPPGESGFRVATAHTDSPALKLKHDAVRNESGYLVAPVEVYGSPIYSSWLDRDLSVAGALVVESEEPQAPRVVPFVFQQPCAVIPNLAIHLNRKLNEGFAYSAHDHLHAVLDIGADRLSGVQPREALLQAAARVAGVQASTIIRAEMFLYDTQPARRTALSQTLFSASQIDNKVGCLTVAEALCAAKTTATTAMAVFYDHEEIGSRSWSGADSVLLLHIMERIVALAGESAEARYRAAAASTIISNDAANGLHPSYRDKHDSAYAPLLGGGPVLKSDANQRYAGTPELEAAFAALCRQEGHPMQQLVSRADMRPGSTVGPFSAAHTGIATIDVGIPLLAMHSIRETAALADVLALRDVLRSYFA
ncbi:MAG: M18 family aminopeptidase [Spirochaetaceae bacterium]|nr:MAG: M18 family aminopeptidase [Spirochaetaceae bacterium]